MKYFFEIKIFFKLGLIVLFLVISNSVFSQNQVIPLWDKIPGAKQSIDYK